MTLSRYSQREKPTKSGSKLNMVKTITPVALTITDLVIFYGQNHQPSGFEHELYIGIKGSINVIPFFCIGKCPSSIYSCMDK